MFIYVIGVPKMLLESGKVLARVKQAIDKDDNLLLGHVGELKEASNVLP